MTTATWWFRCRDNSGFLRGFKVKAATKDEAIRKGFERARKHAKGDIGYDWDCKLITLLL